VVKIPIVDRNATPSRRVRVLVGFRLEDRGHDVFHCTGLAYDVLVVRVNDAGDSEALIAAEVAFELETMCSWFGFFFRGESHAADAGTQTVDVRHVETFVVVDLRSIFEEAGINLLWAPVLLAFECKVMRTGGSRV
jgi:hypothetical protein